MKITRKLTWFVLAGIALTFLSSCSNQNDLADGYGNFDAHAEVIVSSQTMGELQRFNVEEGTHLKAGEVVGLVDTTQLHLKKMVLETQKKAVASKLENINASIAVQQQKLKINETNQRRIQNLFRHNAATQKQLDDINGLVELNKKEIKATQTQKKNIYTQLKSIDAQIAEINESIQQSLITNPVDGTVLVKYAQKGELAVPGKALYKIANLKTLELRAYISGSQLSHIKIGQKVHVYYDKNKKDNYETEGTVMWISSQAEFTPKTIQTKQERVNLVYAVKIKVSNANGALKIGMPGEFRVTPPKK
ncbi:efflux RND transporter periplasmic adaptor subunit [Candidatus Sulfidibacterium hydrothermale]|uniref:HlyD family secretion protein n=1 Tax=Candidatus Sulfidibacterium hydrothermale TaxID=2875962 RepID=UPI001F0AB6CC|nr:efflux RND transporter periplasmic adaptor subunit [Candidatus Sulfidibacterium hydrothermale]UBM62298.1 efflux RND transporter periplasmic adaptor subunit [Candidatus Sulfidibacterium hydrothermale]